MRFSEFKKQRNIRLLIDLEDLEVYHPPNHKLIRLVKDSRSFVGDNGYWYVYPIAVDDLHSFMVCPYCGKVHVHGYSDDTGHRVAHCADNDNRGYFLIGVAELK